MTRHPGRPSRRRRAALCAVAALWAAVAAAAPAPAQTPAPPAWEPRLYNPQPQADDLVLPMPCGGAMAFRKVEVPRDSPLSDRKIVVGGSDERFNFAEASRYDFIDGGFTDAVDRSRRFFWLAKYETTRMQFAALSGECPQATMAGRVPQVETSWHDVVAFARVYTEWLLKHAVAKLPREENATGFLRLPTEAEWEFAARGGTAVSPSDFERPAFPMPEGVEKYAWFQGSRSSNGRLQLAGLLKPNPLGLHDMLGNADEFVLEPFRLAKLARLHGQAGGFVAKGGNYLTDEQDLRAAYRQEIEPFDAQGARRVRTVGFRLALSAVAVTSPRRLDEVRRAWSELPQAAALRAGDRPQSDPLAELATLARATTDLELRARIEALRRDYARRLDEETTLRGRGAKSLLRLGAFLGNKLRDDQRTIDSRRRLREALAAAGSPTKDVDDALKRLDDTMRENLRFYADTVGQIAQDFNDATIGQQLAGLRVEFENRGRGALTQYAAVVAGHVAAYRKTPDLRPESLLADFAALP